MSMILLAVEDMDRDAPIRDLLTAEGWWVTTVSSREEALRATADHAPQLLIIGQELASSAASFKDLLRDAGGCGVLLLVDSPEQAEGGGDVADGLLVRDGEPAQLLAQVRRSLGRPRRAAETAPQAQAPALAHEQLTARDLFGDILEDLGEEHSEEPGEGLEVAAEPAADDETAAASAGAPEAPATEAAEELSGPSETATQEAEEALPEEEVVLPEESVDDGVSPPAAASAEDGGMDEVYEAVARIGPAEDLPESMFEPASGEEPVPVPGDADEESAVEVLDLDELELPDEEPEVPLALAEEAPDAEETVALAEDGEEKAEPTEVMPQEPQAEVAVGGGAGAEAPSDPGPRVQELAPPFSPEDSDDDEPTTDLVEEVADLLESGRSAWLVDGEPDSGVGLSIDEVLAVSESMDEPEPEVAVPAPSDREHQLDASLESDEPAEDDDEDREQVGPYLLIELIEFGDLTERWRARRADGRGEPVVLERVRHELRSRADVRESFVEGYSEAAAWEHESLLKIVDLGRDGDRDFVVTQYRPGRSLREIINRVRRMEARMPLGVSLLIAERLAATFEVLAEAPGATRHGWLVPSSVWVTDDGGVLLREFGFGRLPIGGETLALDWSEHRFIAPERWSGKGDLRSDLYSLGALLYEMVTGQPVHRAADFAALVEAIEEGDIVRAQQIDPTFPVEVDGWVMRLLRRNPTERPQSVAEVSSKIDLALQALPVRPASAEVAAYLRQLFAARVPEAAQPEEPQRPVELAEGETEALVVEEETDEASAREWNWRWLLIPLLVLLAALVAWGLLRGGDATAGLDSGENSRWASVEAMSELGPRVQPPARLH